MQPPTPRMSVTPAAHQISMHSVNDDTAMMRAKKHFSYAMHFPIAQVSKGREGKGVGAMLNNI